jgi:site-specific recombinase XerD
MAKSEPQPVRGVFEFPEKSGTWWINYYVDGKRRREKVGRRQDAIKLYALRKTDALRGIKLPELKRKRAILFDEIAADALAYSKEHKASYAGDASTVKKLLPTFAKVRVQDITQQSLKEYLDTRTDLSKTTINRYRGTLSMIFQEAIRNGKAKSNPARMVRLHKEANARLRFITYHEEEIIRQIILERSPTHEPAFTVALETGMRLTEQHSLTWDQIDLERRQVRLHETKNGTSRTVVLTVKALDALKECQLRRTAKTERVFLTRYGQPMDKPRAWFRLVMKDAIEKDASLSDVTWHTFRHTYISRLVMAGADLRTVQDLCGHKDIKMTIRYSHLSPDHKLAAVDMLTAHRAEAMKTSAG